MTSTVFRIDDFGALAWRLLLTRLGRSETDHVAMKAIAQFERCVYFMPVKGANDNERELAGVADVVCVGLGTIGQGPLNILVEPAFGPLIQVIGSGTDARFTSQQILIGPATRLLFETNVVSKPPGVTVFDLHAALARLAGHSRPRLPAGLDSTLYRARATPAIAAIGIFLSAPGKKNHDVLPPPVNQAIEDLVGLGAGLTPAGDDFLAAVLLTLRCIQRNDIADLLALRVVSVGNLATNRISAAHLRAAAQGYCGETLAKVFSAFARNDEDALDRAVENQIAFGHTSGLDAWFGVLFTVYCAAGQTGRLWSS